MIVFTKSVEYNENCYEENCETTEIFIFGNSNGM
jgi:hypothetical protein